MSGKKVLNRIANENALSETINISHLSPGVYNLTVIGKEIYNVKIIRY